MSLDINNLPMVFPNNVVKAIADRFISYDPIFASGNVLQRPLQPEDGPILAIGVFASQWSPDTESMEIGTMMGGGHLPGEFSTIEHFDIQVQGMVKWASREGGLAAHASIAEIIRAILARDDTLRTQVLGAQVDFAGVTKRCKKMIVRASQYASSQINNDMVYLSVHDVRLEVETISA